MFAFGVNLTALYPLFSEEKPCRNLGKPANHGSMPTFYNVGSCLDNPTLHLSTRRLGPRVQRLTWNSMMVQEHFASRLK